MLRTIIISTTLLAMPVSAVAQSYHATDFGRPTDTRVSLGLTIPIGQGGKVQERKPRLELGFDHRASRRSAEFVGTELKSTDHQKVRIGLSLSKDPHLMLNGREVPEVDGRHNLSTVAWIGIGLVAVVGIGALVGYEMLDDASE